MSVRIVCDCGPSLAQAIGAWGCADCRGEGCPGCAGGVVSEGPCLWCSDDPSRLDPFGIGRGAA